MKTFINYIFTGFFLIICCFITGCIDDPVMPNGNMISGSIYDRYGVKRAVSFRDRYYVSPGNEPITIFENGSDFSINSFALPYDLVITTQMNNFTLKLQGVTANRISPVIYDPMDFQYLNLEPFSFVITIPAIKSKSEIYFVKLISNFIYYQEGTYRELQQGDSILRYSIYIPQENYIANLQQSGKLIIFEAGNLFGDKVDFRKFGYKEFGSIEKHSEITFTDADLAYDLPEVINNFKNVPPPGEYTRGNQISLTFPGNDKSSDIIIYHDLQNDMDETLPILPLDFKVKYTGTYGHGLFYDYAFKTVEIEPAKNGIIIHDIPISLSLPEDNDSNVTGSTQFSIIDNSPGGIYMYEFFLVNSYYESKTLRVFTASKELKFADITSRGFEWEPNKRYYWSVSKFPEFENMDAFVISPFVTSSKYNSTQISTTRKFSTGP